MANPIYFIQSSDRIASRQIRSSHLIIVEGKDDMWFFDTLLTSIEADPTKAQVIDYGSSGELESFLKNLMRQEAILNKTVSGLLIIRDGDDNPGKAFADVGTACRKAGLAIPTSADILRDGTWLIPKLAVQIMPAIGTNGNLETLLLGTVAQNQAVVDARLYVESHHDSQAPANDKRVNQAYLATRPDLHRGVGLASRHGCYDLDHETINSLRTLLREFLE